MAMAILSQGLSSLGLIVDQRATGLTYLFVTTLAMPQVFGLLAPLAMFFGILFAINRLQNESEIAAAFAAGMSRWKLISPILRLATIVARRNIGEMSFHRLIPAANAAAISLSFWRRLIANRIPKKMARGASNPKTCGIASVVTNR